METDYAMCIFILITSYLIFTTYKYMYLVSLFLGSLSLYICFKFVKVYLDCALFKIRRKCLSILYQNLILSSFSISDLQRYIMKKTFLAGGLCAALCVWLYATRRHYAIFLQILALILAAILAIIPFILTFWADPALMTTLISFVPLIGTFLIFLLTAVLVILVGSLLLLLLLIIIILDYSMKTIAPLKYRTAGHLLCIL